MAGTRLPHIPGWCENTWGPIFLPGVVPPLALDPLGWAPATARATATAMGTAPARATATARAIATGNAGTEPSPTPVSLFARRPSALRHFGRV